VKTQSAAARILFRRLARLGALVPPLSLASPEAAAVARMSGIQITGLPEHPVQGVRLDGVAP
jgi:hypothetical protein